MYCKYCGKEIASDVIVCPQCGENVGDRGDKNKKTIIIAIVCCMVVCVIAALILGLSSSKKSDGFVVADADKFLSDMAAGITERLTVGDGVDESAMSAEEKKEYRKKLVNCELDKISGYKTKIFKDERFNEFAHLYISACETQSLALDYFANKELYNALWNGGRTVRAGVITELYKNYALPISEEDAKSYESTESVNVSVNVDSDYDLDDLLPKDKDDVVLNKGELFIVSGEGAFDGDYFEYSFNVNNKSEHNLTSISVSVSLCDSEGNIVGTDYAHLYAVVSAGKSGTVEGNIKKDELSKVSYIQVDSFTYDGNGNHIVYTLYPDKENAENTKIVIP